MNDKWEVIKDIFSVQERVNRLFDDVLSEEGTVEGGGSVSWSPRVDIYETETEFIVNAEIPGVRQEDLNIKVEGNLLVIKGHRPLYKASASEIEKHHMIECSYGNFRRSFLLSDSIDAGMIRAALQEGVLRIILPKKAGSVTKQITVE